MHVFWPENISKIMKIRIFFLGSSDIKLTYASLDLCKFDLSHYGLNNQPHVDLIYINLSYTVRVYIGPRV